VLTGLIDGQMRSGVLGFAQVEAHLERYRERVGRFIGARAHEIAFLRNTGDGANVVARGLDWKPGDEIVISANEFGSNALPWIALREQGVTIEYVRAPAERMTPAALERHMTPRTRVVAVSWVSFTDGYRHDLPALAEVAHAGGALFCVDAMQALGAFSIDVKRAGVDVLYAGGAKWLLTPPGVSFLYVDAALQDRLVPRWRGWRDVADIWDFLDYDQALAPNASRYEGGTLNYLGIAALATSMDVIDEGHPAAIEAHVLALTDELVVQLQGAGAHVLSERKPGTASAIVTFQLSGVDPVALGRALGRDGIVVTYRSGGVRVSPHGHNTGRDIEALVAGIERARSAAIF